MSARRFLFFDTETTAQEIKPYTKELTFRLGHAIYLEYGKNWKVKRMETFDLEIQADFIEVLESVGSGLGTLFCVAHNLAFDIQVLDLPHLLHQAGWRLELPSFSFATTLWRVHKGKSAVHFLDSANLFPGKLRELGRDINLPKYEINPLDTTEELLWRYCRRDVMILVKLFQKYLKWLRDEDLGYFGETLGWQAMNAYRSRFYAGNIIIHDDYVVLGYEREAYHGARCECFFIGTAPQATYTLLDVNSMYGYAMANNEYPVELVSVEIGVSLKRLAELLDEYYVIAECEVSTDDPVYAYKAPTKLVFPTGRYSTWLHASECEWALRHSHISKVGKLLLYRRANIFGDYVRYLDMVRKRARKEGKALEERLAKLFLNSLSGKMGQKGHQVYHLGKAKHQGIQHYVCRVAGTNYVFDQWDYFGNVFSSIRAGEKPYSCPSIAGAITAYARMYLWELIKKAGQDNVFYCDTDSLLVNEKGLANLASLQNEMALGSLKTVAQAQDLQIFGPKDYRLGVQVRRKGTRRTDNPQDSAEGKGEEFQRLQTAMKQGQHGSVLVREVTKERRATYDKGKVLPSGRVIPRELPRDEKEPVFRAR